MFPANRDYLVKVDRFEKKRLPNRRLRECASKGGFKQGQSDVGESGI